MSEESTHPQRPDPLPSRDSAFFWEGAARGELLGQQCDGCGTFRHPPRPMCPGCRSLDWTATPLSGRGTVHSWMRPVHPPLPMFDPPPLCVLVDLEEGIRLFSNLYGCGLEDVSFGMPVEVAFATTRGGKAVPVFRPLLSSPDGREPRE